MPQKPIDVNLDLNELLGLRKGKPSGPDPKALERAVVLVNEERNKLGLHPLQSVPVLFQVAQAHASDMDQRGYLGNATPEGDPVAAKARRAGYEGKAEVLVADGAEQPDGVIREWLGSAQYQKHLLSETYQHIGVGTSDGLWAFILGAPPSLQMSEVRELRLSVLRLLNEERRKQLTKVAAGYAENTKVAIRNVRRDGMDQIKKAKAAGMSEDDQKMWSDEVQELTDKHIVMVDKALETKQAEIMHV